MWRERVQTNGNCVRLNEHCRQETGSDLKSVRWRVLLVLRGVTAESRFNSILRVSKKPEGDKISVNEGFTQ